ncbi:MAG TPA: hypothetical protein VIQ30_08325 [Pseudonocardia sp.]
MIKRMVAAAVTTATVWTIIGGIGAYLAYRYALQHGYSYATLPGPFTSWRNTWLWTALLPTAVALPRTLYRAYKQGPGPAPGGAIVAHDQAEDVTYIRQVANWVEQHAEAVKTSAPGDQVHPPCLRCGREVNGFRLRTGGLTLMRFKPCGCRIMVTKRARERLKTG